MSALAIVRTTAWIGLLLAPLVALDARAGDAEQRAAERLGRVGLDPVGLPAPDAGPAGRGKLLGDRAGGDPLATPELPTPGGTSTGTTDDPGAALGLGSEREPASPDLRSRVPGRAERRERAPSTSFGSVRPSQRTREGSPASAYGADPRLASPTPTPSPNTGGAGGTTPRPKPRTIKPSSGDEPGSSGGLGSGSSPGSTQNVRMPRRAGTPQPGDTGAELGATRSGALMQRALPRRRPGTGDGQDSLIDPGLHGARVSPEAGARAVERLESSLPNALAPQILHDDADASGAPSLPGNRSREVDPTGSLIDPPDLGEPGAPHPTDDPD